MATSRLALPQPSGTDLISGGDDAITLISDTLDSAAMWASGVFASRPAAAALAGKFYLATDTGILYLSDGTNWIEVTRGGGTIPIGGLLDFAGSSDPSDTRFILADGRAISRATYATLFSLIGTTFGAGNGTTTFNVPDLRGRVAVGPDNMGTAQGAASRMASNNALGNSGGAETCTLSSGNLAAHAHSDGTLATDTFADHTHGVGTFVTGSTGDHAHGVGTYANATTSAGTPAGAISSDSAGTPTGTNTAASAGTPAGSVNAETTDHTHSGSVNAETGDHTHAGTTSTSANHQHGVPLIVSGGGPIDFYTAQPSGKIATQDPWTNTDAGGAHNHTMTTGGRSSSHTHSFTSGGRSSSHTHTFTGSALGTHNHSWAGDAMDTHTHTFTGSAMGSHGHAISGSSATTGAHTHTLSGSSGSAGGHSHDVTGSTGSVGSGTPFNLTQPYVVLNKIIRIS